MDFVNHTAFPAKVVRAQLLYKNLLMATVVAKCSFEVDANGEVSAVADPLPIAEEDVTTPLGAIDGDVVPIKPWCDLALLGHAYSYPLGTPTSALEAVLRIGDFERRLAVIGDRVWTEGAYGLVPTAPAPFVAMPLTYDRAFGGTAVFHKELRGPSPENPAGRGFVKLREHVVGTPLPNLEEVDQRLRGWDECPLPAGFAPLPRTSSMRGLRGMDVDLDAQTTRMGPAAFAFAHPRMQLPAYPGGVLVETRALHRRDGWSFVLPTLNLFADVTLGTARYRLPLVPDTICILPDYNRFYVVARRALVYQFLPERERSIVVTGAAGSDLGGAPTTIQAERASPTPALALGPVSTDMLPLPFDELLRLYPLTDLIESLPLCLSG
jgi:hypothetical protein